MKEGRATDRRRKRVSLAGTLVGVGVLVALGFAIGMVVGATFEEPDLLIAHLRGETQEVPLPEAPPPVEAATPGDSAPLARPAPAAAEVPPVAAAPRREGGFAIQVGAFADRAPALRLMEALRGKELPVYLADGEGPGGVRWRVRVGPVHTREEAERLAAHLKAEERLPTWVLEEEGG